MKTKKPQNAQTVRNNNEPRMIEEICDELKTTATNWQRADECAQAFGQASGRDPSNKRLNASYIGYERQFELETQKIRELAAELHSAIHAMVDEGRLII